MHPHQTSSIRLTLLWSICFAFAVHERTAEAQVAHPVVDASLISRPRAVDPAVMKSLHDGSVEQALKLLEGVADETGPIVLAEEDRLSHVCAGLNRLLNQQDSESQFDLLRKWSMPADSPPRIRILTSIVPTVVPPAEFARVLGERPRSSTFPVASIGEVKGLFCTSWLLVVAARDSGKLKRLMSDVRTSVDKKVPNADLLMALAQIADARTDLTDVAQQLSRKVDQLRSPPPKTDGMIGTIDSTTIVLATAALQRATLRRSGEELLELLTASTAGQSAPFVGPFLRRTHAASILLPSDDRKDAPSASMWDFRLKYWVPVSDSPIGSDSLAMTDSTWLVHEDNLLHLSGPGNDSLLCRYPIVGDFRFECETETQFAGQPEIEGGLNYGGLGFHIKGQAIEFQVIDPFESAIKRRNCPFAGRPSPSTFNRMAIVSTTDAVTTSVNLHPMSTDNTGFETSPWVGLTSPSESRPMFRNLKLSGQPVIPRSVRLVEGQQLRGWRSLVLNPPPDAKVPTDVVWKVTDGILQVNRPEATTPSDQSQQMLSYQRPLLDGESVSYEFFYEPDVTEVHATLGRVAFLFHPEGIRIHWVTDRAQDWTGLDSQNTLTEPLSRRGPRPLPLKPNEWNRAILARTAAAVTLTLNDLVIYQRPIDWTGDLKFGFYRDRPATGVQVRNVVLKGDWPEALPQEFFDHPTVTLGNEQNSLADHHALNRLFQEQILAVNVSAVRHKALKMSTAERFEYLSQWVLPGPSHPGFRMAGEFSQTQPSPIAFEPGVMKPEDGGQIVSPVFDWLDAAKELGRTNECRQRVENAVVPDDEFQHRAQASLLILLNLELNDEALISSNTEKLISLFKTQTPIGVEDQWPETLVVARGAEKFLHHPSVAELIAVLHLQRTIPWHPAGRNLWHFYIAGLLGRLPQKPPTNSERILDSTSRQLKDWIPVTACKSFTRGQGFPNVEWTQRENGVAKLVGHAEDHLFYRQPLSGEFELECDCLQPLQHCVQIMAAGYKVGSVWDEHRIEIGSFRFGGQFYPVNPPLRQSGQSMHVRTVIRNDTVTTYINGRSIHSVVLPKFVDPWVAIHSWGNRRSHVQNFRIMGRPNVLDAVPMSASSDLSGWIDYHEEAAAAEGSRWKHAQIANSAGWIIGRTNPGLAGMNVEDLLRYQRPLVEDGSIDYEFFYKPGTLETHPALDRLAMILHPSGVREHWITDGHHDRTDVPPDNLSDVPECRRGPDRLPLIPGKWNRMKLVLRGETVLLELNGVLIYERTLEPTNERTFGLFHYADKTEVRVRNAVMRGDWPKVLKPVSEQELAGNATDSIDAGLPHFKSVFKHDFQKAGLPNKYFTWPAQSAGSKVVETADGVEVSVTGSGGWIGAQISPRFELVGDFDLEAKFEKLNIVCSEQHASSQIRVVFDAPLQPEFGITRTIGINNYSVSCTTRNLTQPGGRNVWLANDSACESSSGRFRLARRGDNFFYLFAEEDSDNFQLRDTQAVPKAGSARDGIGLLTDSMGFGTSQVVWKNLVLRAERLKWYPDPNETRQVVLAVVKSDGTGLRIIARPSTFGFTHVGSPEWSMDARKMVVDMANESTATSRIFIMNADGSGVENLGSGCMPSLSNDGREIVFTQPGKGIMKMTSSGTDRTVLDPEGWGAQWSPDGKWIAYGKAGNITLFDVKTRKTKPLLNKETAKLYASVYQNFGWSRDSRFIAFKARRADGNPDQIAIAEMNSPDGFKVLLSNADSFHPDCTFLPDNQSVVVKSSNNPRQLYKINRKSPNEPEPIFNQPLTFDIIDFAWSPDGKPIAISGTQIPRTVEWLNGFEEAPPTE